MMWLPLQTASLWDSVHHIDFCGNEICCEQIPRAADAVLVRWSCAQGRKAEEWKNGVWWIWPLCLELYIKLGCILGSMAPGYGLMLVPDGKPTKHAQPVHWLSEALCTQKLQALTEITKSYFSQLYKNVHNKSKNSGFFFFNGQIYFKHICIKRTKKYTRIIQ